MSAIDELLAAKTFGSGSYMTEADHGVFPTCVVRGFKINEGHRGTAYICEATVVESNAGNTRPAGSTFSVVNKKATPGGLSRAKSLIAAVAGVDADDLSADDLTDALGPNNVLAGTLCRVEVGPHVTDSGKTITRVTFERLPESVQKDATKILKAAGI